METTIAVGLLCYTLVVSMVLMAFSVTKEEREQ